MGVSSWRIYCNEDPVAQQQPQQRRPQQQEPESPFVQESQEAAGEAGAAGAAGGSGASGEAGASAGQDLPGVAQLGANLGGRLRSRSGLQQLAPFLPLPRLPKLVPGARLDPAQREELLSLQQQIQVQLGQQRLLVDSIRRLPQFHDRDPESGSIPAAIAETAERVLASLMEQDEVIERIRTGKHLVGPSPAGDLPARDPEAEEEAAGAGGEAQGAATAVGASVCGLGAPRDLAAAVALGTTQKVFVDLNACPAGPAAGIWPSVGRRAPHGPESIGKPPIFREEPGDGEPRLLTPRSWTRLRASEARSPGSEAGAGAGDTVATGAASTCSSGLSPATPSTSSSQADALGTSHKERLTVAMIPALHGQTVAADERLIGTVPPNQPERRWIEAALRRMFRSLGPPMLESITESFREWKLPPCAAIVKQGAPVSTGPGLCVLFTGVIDVFHCQKGSKENEKVCTYDRCGQCFGEIELFFDSPRSLGTGRKAHWATIATRTPVTLWTISRSVLRSTVPGAAGSCASCGSTPPQQRQAGQKVPQLLALQRETKLREQPLQPVGQDGQPEQPQQQEQLNPLQSPRSQPQLQQQQPAMRMEACQESPRQPLQQLQQTPSEQPQQPQQQPQEEDQQQEQRQFAMRMEASPAQPRLYRERQELWQEEEPQQEQHHRQQQEPAIRTEEV